MTAEERKEEIIGNMQALRGKIIEKKLKNKKVPECYKYEKLETDLRICIRILRMKG
jgi:hypothetical protein